ncbi:MAG: DNA-3-methyladenine glycosylase [Clostridiales bacterium]|nr:DNA-3-methyladenine glycosylase [Clostridiales bacterium]
MKKLDRAFFLRDTITVAGDLLGRILVHHTEEGLTAGRIVETEAYCGVSDAACHSAKGNRQGRVAIMYGEGGFAYVYLIYGMYCCMNVVTRPEEHPEAVLIRALEPLEGVALMAERRNQKGLTEEQQWRALCSGPGKLCQAMAIDRSCYGLDLLGDKLYLLEGQPIAAEEVGTTARINVSYAGEAAAYPWRFIIKDSSYVSVAK